MVQLTTQQQGDELRVVVRGGVNPDTVDQFSHDMLDLAAGSPKVVTLDLHQLEYIYSDGLAVVIELAARLKRSGGALRIERASTRMRELLATTRLDMLLTIVHVDAES